MCIMNPVREKDVSQENAKKSYEMETSCEEPLKMKTSKKGNGVQQILTL